MTNSHFTIELAGMPRSGKSTVNDALVHYFRSAGYLVDEFNGGSRTVPGYIDKSDLSTINLYLIAQTLTASLIQPAALGGERVQLFDRGIVDRLIFTEALYATGHASKQQLDMVRSLVSLAELQHRIDLLIVLTVSAKVALLREAAAKFVVGTGRVMGSDVLDALSTSTYGLLSRPNPACVRNRIHIDTSDLTPQQLAAKIGALIARELKDPPKI